MAHELLKAEQIASQALGLLQRELVLPRYTWSVSDYFAAKHPGALNDTVNLPVPAILDAREYEWRTRTSPIITDDLEETKVPIKLDKHCYSAVGVTDEAMTLDITQFGQLVTTPQVRAVGEKLESYVAEGLADAPWKETVAWSVAGETARSGYDALLDARKILNDGNVPQNDRIALIGSSVERAILRDPHLHEFDRSGDADAFREAQIGRIAGMTLVQSNSLPEDAMYVYHRSAIAHVQLAPIVPDGVPYGAVRTAFGMSMRWIRDYDSNFLRDRSVFSAFSGVSSVNDDTEATTDGVTGITTRELTGKNRRGVKFVITGLG